MFRRIYYKWTLEQKSHLVSEWLVNQTTRDFLLFGKWSKHVKQTYPKGGNMADLVAAMFPPGYSWRMEDVYQETRNGKQSKLINMICMMLYGKKGIKCVKQVRQM